MADVRNCRRCGKVFTYVGSPVCSSCKSKDQEEFRVIRDYLFSNPNSSAIEISEATGIRITKIFSFLEEGRLSSGDEDDKGSAAGDYIKDAGPKVESNSSPGLTCIKCGRPIRAGRLCGVCDKIY